MYVKKPLNLCGEPNHLVVFYFLNKTKRNILKKHVPIFSLRNKWSKTNSPVFLKYAVLWLLVLKLCVLCWTCYWTHTATVIFLFLWWPAATRSLKALDVVSMQPLSCQHIQSVIIRHFCDKQTTRKDPDSPSSRTAWNEIHFYYTCWKMILPIL